ncbi:MAG: type II toxin-antitoxin system YafQ family toxin, partial [Synergistaceae bacterium]|nr:type II toxin-antitoxin system YafQ family toxin [Synergistaceae bacterium]
FLFRFAHVHRSSTYRQTAAFKRDFKRENKGWSRHFLKERLWGVVNALAKGTSLDPSYRDRSLGGSRRDHRGRHIVPDLLLLYYLSEDALTLVRLGSHSELLGL